MWSGKGSVRVFDLGETLTRLFKVLESKTYFNDPVVMTLKALAERIRQNSQGNGRHMSLRTAIRTLHEVLGIDDV